MCQWDRELFSDTRYDSECRSVRLGDPSMERCRLWSLERRDELQYSDAAFAGEVNFDLPHGNDLDEDADLHLAGAEWSDLVLLVVGWTLGQCVEEVVYA